jgi:hypothetical protein
MSLSIDIKTAIGKLLLCAETNESAKHVITAFDASAKRTANFKALNKFGIDVLENCALFLGIKLADGGGFKLFTKDSLINRLLFGILAHLPSSCSECKEQYVVEHQSETPPPSMFHCRMCFQGSHDCSNIKDLHGALSSASITLLEGHVWLCHDCIKESNPIKPRKAKTRHNSLMEPEDQLSSPKNQTSAEIVETSSSSETLQNDAKKDELNAKLSRLAKTDVCSKYKAGKCLHGIRGNKVVEGKTCDQQHPKRCFKFCGFGDKHKSGCKKGDRCEYYHPVLCKFSVKTRICTKRDCTFVHLKGTKRKEPNQPEPRKAKIEKNEVSFKHSSSSPSPAKRNSVNHSTSSSDLFLELKRLVEAVQSNFRQEIAEIRSSLAYPPLKYPYVQYQPTQLHPGMSYIPRSSC